MFLNGFSVKVIEGTEKSSYVYMQDGQQYRLSLRNRNSERCDAAVSIDGKDVGTFRIPAGENFILERPAHDDGKFTFFAAGSEGFYKSGSDAVPAHDLGLIQVVFTPEKPRQVLNVSYRASSGIDDVAHAAAYNVTQTTRSAGTGAPKTAGGTGLTGKSEQDFITVSNLDYDYSKQTRISLRLVLDEDTPRPLTAYSTPVPPPVK
jgi:hypothetical protein